MSSSTRARMRGPAAAVVGAEEGPLLPRAGAIDGVDGEESAEHRPDADADQNRVNAAAKFAAGIVVLAHEGPRHGSTSQIVQHEFRCNIRNTNLR